MHIKVSRDVVNLSKFSPAYSFSQNKLYRSKKVFVITYAVLMPAAACVLIFHVHPQQIL